MRRFSLLFVIPIVVLSAISSAAQSTSTALQTSFVERDLRVGQTHSYTVNLEREQFLQLAIQPGGLAVVVRVFLPDGKLLREVTDFTNADIAYVELVSEFSGTYRFEIASTADVNAGPTHYQIKIAELRRATDAELRVAKNANTRRSQGLALLVETAQHLDQFRRPENRVEMQLEAAQLLWPSDEKQAQKLMMLAMETVKQVVAQNTDADAEVDDGQLAMRLRTEVIRVLAPHDPETALKFLRATRQPVEVASSAYGQADPEIQLESTLVNQVIAADPKRAYELAQDMLNRSFSNQLIETLNRLIQKDQDLASRLAHSMAEKIESQDLIKTREAAYLAGSLLQTLKMTQQGQKPNGDGADHHGLLSDEEFRELFLKVVGDLLAFSSSDTSFYSPELDNARVLAATVRQLDTELKTYAADRAALIEKKVTELTGFIQQMPPEWQRFQNAANDESTDVALDTIAQAPTPMRDFLYQQVATRVANSGDMPRAQQLIMERISNPTQREQALNNLRQQAVTTAAAKGQIDEALRLLSKFKSVQERIGMMTQILGQIGPETKRSLAVQYIEQAKNLITTSARARDAQQMDILLQIAATLGPFDASRAFQIVDPLIDQFNEISSAAVSMNGFGHDFYADGELITSNDNPVASTAKDLSGTLATLAMFDFDRAKIAADAIQRMDVRLRVYLAIAQRTLEIEIETADSTVYSYNQE